MQKKQVATVTTTATTVPTSAVAAATMNVTTGNVTPDIDTPPPTMPNTTGTTAATAITTSTSPLADSDNNPFLVSLPYDQSAYAEQEQPLQASQLEDELRILSIHSPQIRSPQSSSISQSDTDTTSDASAGCQPRRKEAQDVKAFFREQNKRWYCKFCEWVFYLSILLAFLT